MGQKLKRPVIGEIEMTPEIIDAGVLKLVSYDVESSDEEEVVFGIFKAMYEAHKSSVPN